MSSHREAPRTSREPAIDSTDVYAFVSPDNPETVTILANYVPLQDPAGGPNFYEFGDDVLYEINIDNDGDGLPEVTYQWGHAPARLTLTPFLTLLGLVSSTPGERPRSPSTRAG
jgi:hypothetical protein